MGPHPAPPFADPLFLGDRAYEGQSDTQIAEAVDFIFEGNGILLGRRWSPRSGQTAETVGWCRL